MWLKFKDGAHCDQSVGLVCEVWNNTSRNLVYKRPSLYNFIQIVEEINYMFRLFSGWAIIRLRLEYRRKLTSLCS
jgi:hypothetical protein